MTDGSERAWKTIQFERCGSYAILTLDRPDHLNAADHVMHAELVDAFRNVGRDSTLRSIILTGSGRAFCAGGDTGLLLQMYQTESIRREVLQQARDLIRAAMDIEAPLVAAVNGPAVGLGCSLASLCDIVLMAESAYFQDPHVPIGLAGGDGGALTWPAYMSLLKAKEYLLLGDRIPADTAVSLGLANRTVPDRELMSEACALAQRLAELPVQAVQGTKKLLDLALKSFVDRTIDMANSLEMVSFESDDFGRIIKALGKARSERR